MDVMLCYRCAQVYKTDRLICPTCKFVMVGATVDEHDGVKLRTLKPPLVNRRHQSRLR